jgi:hypothetical protein
VVLSIIPRLTIWASLGALTQKRTLPVVEIVPLNVVPAGITYCNWLDDAERVKVGTVVANAERAINDANSKAVNAVEISNLVFFIFPLDGCPQKRRQVLITIALKKRKTTWLSMNVFRRRVIPWQAQLLEPYLRIQPKAWDQADCIL